MLQYISNVYTRAFKLITHTTHIHKYININKVYFKIYTDRYMYLLLDSQIETIVRIKITFD